MREPLRRGGGSGAVPCRAGAGARAGAVRGKARLSAALHFLPDMFTAMMSRGFPPLAVATLLCGLAGFLSPCLCSCSAPFNPDSSPTMGRCRRESGPSITWSPGGAMPQHPGSWRQEAKVSRGVYGLSVAARRSPGTACAGQLLPAPGVRAVSEQWVESRKRHMGNRIWLRRRRQPRPLGPFPFPAPESPSHSRQPRGCTKGTEMLPPGRAGA